MDWTNIAQLSDIAEIVAAVLVVLSLGYIIVQIHQYKHTERVQAAQRYVDMCNTITSDLVKSDVARIWISGIQNFASLEDSEQVQFSAVAAQYIRVCESAYFQWRKRAIDEQIWRAIERSLTDTYAMPGFREWWEYRRDWYTEDFQALVDRFEISEDQPTLFPCLEAEVS